METKKDIGAAVKQRLETFKDSPDDLVWQNIEGQLKKKKKRRFLIFWLSGVGLATLILLLWTSNPFQNKTNEIIPISSTADYTSDSNSKQSNTNGSHTFKTDKEGNNISNSNAETNYLKHDTLCDSQRLQNLKNKNHVVTHKKQTAAKNRNKSASNINKYSNLHKNTNPKKITHIDNENPSQESDKILNEIRTDDHTERNIIGNLKSDSLLTHSNEKLQDTLTKTNKDIKTGSQEKTKDSLDINGDSRWSVSPQALLSYYGAFSKKSENNFSINYGALLSYRVTDNTFLRIGARSLKLKQKVDNFNMTLEYIELPIGVKYAFTDKKFNAYITGGVSYFILQDAKVNDTNTSEYSSTMSLNAGLGVEYKLFESTYFSLESNFNYQIKPILENNTINPFIISISTGIEYRF